MGDKEQKVQVVDIQIDEQNHISYNDSPLEQALFKAEIEKELIDENYSQYEDIKNELKAECDPIDYSAAASTGVLCGILDIFLVGTPGKSPLGDKSDSFISKAVDKFMKLNDCKSLKELEEKYKVPYDQTHPGESFKEVFDINPKNHHFKSLAHNPTLLGLFCSLLDQFNNTSHFVDNGDTIILDNADDNFELKGNTLIGKFFCGFANWIGHLTSDVSGSSSSKGRGMGIPSPVLSWSNDIIALKNKFGIKPNKFDKAYNELCLDLYKRGYDERFEFAKSIPVIVNELVTRLFYAIRRLVQYLISLKEKPFSLKELIKTCEPFKNATVNRMVLVAHASFCTTNLVDAIVEGAKTGNGYAFAAVFLMRLNVPGLGKFAISLFGELKRDYKWSKQERDYNHWLTRKHIVDGYIETLLSIEDYYDDTNILDFIDSFEDANYPECFKNSVALARQRGVSGALKTKEDIDAYFTSHKKDETVTSLVSETTSIETTKKVGRNRDDDFNTTVDLLNNKINDFDSCSEVANKVLSNTQNQIDLIRGLPASYKDMYNNIKSAVIRWEENERIVASKNFKNANTNKALDNITRKQLVNMASLSPVMLADPLTYGTVSLLNMTAFAGFKLYGLINNKIFESNKKRLEQINQDVQDRFIKKYNVAYIDLDERTKAMKIEMHQLERMTFIIATFGTDYSQMESGQQYMLGSCLNLMESIKELVVKEVNGLQIDYKNSDFNNFLLVHAKANKYSKYSDCQRAIMYFANLYYGISLSSTDWMIIQSFVINNKELMKELMVPEQYLKMTNNFFDGVKAALIAKEKEIKLINEK